MARASTFSTPLLPQEPFAVVPGVLCDEEAGAPVAAEPQEQSGLGDMEDGAASPPTALRNDEFFLRVTSVEFDRQKGFVGRRAKLISRDAHGNFIVQFVDNGELFAFPLENFERLLGDELAEAAEAFEKRTYVAIGDYARHKDSGKTGRTSCNDSNVERLKWRYRYEEWYLKFVEDGTISKIQRKDKEQLVGEEHAVATKVMESTMQQLFAAATKVKAWDDGGDKCSWLTDEDIKKEAVGSFLETTPFKFGEVVEFFDVLETEGGEHIHDGGGHCIAGSDEKHLLVMDGYGTEHFKVYPYQVEKKQWDAEQMDPKVLELVKGADEDVVVGRIPRHVRVHRHGLPRKF